MGNQQSRDNLKRSLTVRRGGNRSTGVDEYTAIDIREKYERMPKVSAEERMIIKSSWRTIKNKVIQQVNINTMFNVYYNIAIYSNKYYHVSTFTVYIN